MAATRKKTQPSPEEWAKAHPRRRGRPCWICARPEAAAHVEEFLAMGEASPSAAGITEYLWRVHGCPLQSVTVSQHMRAHIRPRPVRS